LSISTHPILSHAPEFFASFTLTVATDLPLSTLQTINAACRLANRPFYAAQSLGLYGYIFADLIIHTFVISREKSNMPTQLGPETATRTLVSVASKASDSGKPMELVTKQEAYTPLILANTSPLPSWYLSSRRRKLGVTPLLSCLRALWEYQSLANRVFPSHSHADIALFTTLATSKHQELQLHPETLRADFLRAFLQNLGSELSPVCAFLGGQLAQDVINVIGGKEQPIQNLLLFDGEESKGPIYAMHPIFPVPPNLTDGFMDADMPAPELV
jgi:ubiquitin-like 1-activating enzyme E1 A